MVGREAELDMLRWTLRRTDQTQRPHLVTVLGQAGIGKSRLTVAVLEHLASAALNHLIAVMNEQRIGSSSRMFEMARKV